jgi:hypothetical protein
MVMSYHHTQRGVWMMAALLAAALLDAFVAWRSGQWSPLVALIVLIAAAVVFSSLTVDVNARELRWYFGPGFWNCQVPLDDIQNVAVVQNHWWNGFGIRMRPGFRLYNVSGLDAVELRLKSGEIRRIGTDDPQGLAEALKSVGLRG